MTSLEIKVANKQRQIYNQLLNDYSWKSSVDAQIARGKKRVLHTLFESPEDCFKNNIDIKVLTEEELYRFYPNFVHNTINMPPNKYCYIFCCKNVTHGGKNPFITQNFIVTNK